MTCFLAICGSSEAIFELTVFSADFCRVSSNKSYTCGLWYSSGIPGYLSNLPCQRVFWRPWSLWVFTGHLSKSFTTYQLQQVNNSFPSMRSFQFLDLYRYLQQEIVFASSCWFFAPPLLDCRSDLFFFLLILKCIGQYFCLSGRSFFSLRQPKTFFLFLLKWTFSS